MAGRAGSFEAFYAAYLAAHRHPANRALHLSAKLGMLALIVAAVFGRQPLLVLAVPLAGVAPCWLGHLLFEGNRPGVWVDRRATLLGSLWPFGRSGGGSSPSTRRPYYSFLADLRMCAAIVGLGGAPDPGPAQGEGSDRT